MPETISPQAVQHQLMQINRLHYCAAEKRMRKAGIHRSQHMLLMYLYHAGHCPSQKEIAKRFEISPAAVAVGLKKLESGGYISRVCCENDNRLNEITLTDKGREIVALSKQAFEELDEQVYAGLTEEEMTALSRMLEKIQKNLKELTGKDEAF